MRAKLGFERLARLAELLLAAHRITQLAPNRVEGQPLRGLNARQRRSADRLRKFQEKVRVAKYASCASRLLIS